MPRLNLYEQQTSAQGPRASGADFGAAPAQALEGAGNALYDIGERIQRRDELLAADQVMTDVDTWALTALDDFSKRQDITSQQSLPEFQNALKQKRAEALSKFTGRPEARAALERQLDNQLAQYGKSAISTKIKAGNALMTRSVEQQFDKSANQVAVAPQILEDAISENMAFVNSRKDAMSAELYQAALTKAQAAPIQAAVQAHIQNGAWDAAEAVMADPRFNKLLAPEQARPLRIDVAVGRGKAEKERRDTETNVRQWEAVTGSKIDPSKYAELPDFKSAPAAQKIASHQLIFGVPPTEEQKLKYFGLDRQAQESRVDRIVELAMNYDNLDATDRMKLTALIKSEYRDINGVDQFGNPTRVSTVPAEFQRFVGAMPQRNQTTGNPAVTGSTGSGDTGPFLDPEGRMYPAGTKITMPDGVPATIDSRGHAIADTPAAGGAPGAQAPQLEDSDVIDLYDNAGKVVGLEAWIKRNAANLPLNIGDSLKISPVYGRAAQTAQVLQNDIVRGFVNMGGGKDVIANQYRQELSSIVALDPKIFGSEREYRFKLQNIDAELRKKLREYEKTAQTGATLDMRQAAAAGVSTINNIVARLNIPQKKVTGQQEYEKLQPGERYLWLDDPTPRVKGGRK